ncbi:N-acetylglucosamine-1-phosphotransferase subunit gamma-like isoform X2 [Anneissia japonica]|uniref:N-acetylglucosamine-1-phosphotransferase subunit gamma-like isoform X2 n=1 Tax=Anneissia japonica TaxID=1529436 RepID=UPI0014255E23|nr:N-acetylglucosamine-1-phosphotransferase subunit gamma-like isoform X2 [Anneissia japonica]XP_033108652.1 N-acetylglucosamine-1-phosphotransferase subunit gamma-like isoform X2 [Anneissia japonica]
MNTIEWILIQIILTVMLVTGGSERVKMRLVQEPSNYGYNQQANDDSMNSLKPRVKAANFSGPPHLRRLKGKCFSLIQSSYKYEFCPFQNVTQHEQSLRWNPYSGILGIWQEWEIRNNSFYALKMREGDVCGEHGREVTVKLVCGTKHELTSVEEPVTCKYEMQFKTPLVCHKHSLLVYPTLSVELRNQWNELEGQLLQEDVTQKGYQKRLNAIFQAAGFVMDSKVHDALKIQNKVENKREEPSGRFTSLDSCSEAYTKLEKEVERLQGLVAKNTYGNSTVAQPTKLP